MFRLSLHPEPGRKLVLGDSAFDKTHTLWPLKQSYTIDGSGATDFGTRIRTAHNGRANVVTGAGSVLSKAKGELKAEFGVERSIDAGFSPVQN